MPSLPSRKIFPSWTLTDIDTRDEFATVITPSNGSEAGDSVWAFSRWVINLSGGLCSTEQRREIKAFNRYVRGRAKKFWYRRYHDPEWEMTGPDGSGEYLGTGDGIRTQFQARIYDDVQGDPVWAADLRARPRYSRRLDGMSTVYQRPKRAMSKSSSTAFYRRLGRITPCCERAALSSSSRHRRRVPS